MLKEELETLERALKQEEERQLEEYQRLEREKQRLEWQVEGQSTSDVGGGWDGQDIEIDQSLTLDRNPRGDKYEENLKRGLAARLMEEYTLDEMMGKDELEIIRKYLDDRFGSNKAHTGFDAVCIVTLSREIVEFIGWREMAYRMIDAMENNVKMRRGITQELKIGRNNQKSIAIGENEEAGEETEPVYRVNQMTIDSAPKEAS